MATTGPDAAGSRLRGNVPAGPVRAFLPQPGTRTDHGDQQAAGSDGPTEGLRPLHLRGLPGPDQDPRRHACADRSGQAPDPAAGRGPAAHGHQRPAVEAFSGRERAQHRLRPEGRGQLPDFAVPPAGHGRRRHPLHSRRYPRVRHAGHAGRAEGADPAAARPLPDGRGHRRGQDHHAGLADRLSQRALHRPHPHAGRPDRVRLPQPALHRQPAPDRLRHA